MESNVVTSNRIILKVSYPKGGFQGVAHMLTHKRGTVNYLHGKSNLQCVFLIYKKFAHEFFMPYYTHG
jgi:hypothetical protein